MLVTTILFFASCSGDFTDLRSENTLCVDCLPPGASPYEGIQNGMYTKGWFDYNFKGMITQGDTYAGNVWANDGEFRPFAEASVLNDNAVLNSNWTGLFSVVNQANSLMQDLINDKENIPEDAYIQGIGVSKFMRATAYFYLVRIWGPVPIYDENSSGINAFRNLESDVYKFIEMDLEDASEKLTENPKIGRVGKYSAMGMLAKVKLNLQKYDEAAQLCREVINSGKYDLLEDYGNLFNNPNFNNSKESLFSLQWTVNCNEWGTQNTEQAFIVPSGSGITGGGDGWGSYMPTIDLPGLYELGDKRRKPSIMVDGDVYPELLSKKGGYTFDKLPSQTALNFRKYIVGSAEDGYNVCFMRTEQNTNVLRFADILLMLAEAKLGASVSTSDGEALLAFNRVRSRAGLGAVTEITQTSLFKERRIEFLLEGQYYFDLQRRNRADALAEIAAQERGFYGDGARTELVSIKVSPTDDYFTLPLPAGAISINVNLTAEPVPFNF
ncbi:Starch-binding associating with outer membrane [Cellulophaga tyrosinoxydans]|uniref:Starch-binding associating with outer membrane n=3 Tax=Flavobacteriales TaxID=200644 RepID=A0A1W2CS08_9FLAO|nr:Starch-binding associating with outer membrane [Algibacter pectinivorans]SMC87983.1 Starch-binding associating with outer membrane [Cellulophaga tyrosinoxydans]